MIIIISIALLLQQTIGNTVFFEEYYSTLLCFGSRFLHFYLSFVYLLLLAAVAVNLFVKVGLVFETIDHFPLKASLIAFSESVHCRVYRLMILYRYSHSTAHYWICIQLSIS